MNTSEPHTGWPVFRLLSQHTGPGYWPRGWEGHSPDISADLQICLRRWNLNHTQPGLWGLGGSLSWGPQHADVGPGLQRAHGFWSRQEAACSGVNGGAKALGQEIHQDPENLACQWLFQTQAKFRDVTGSSVGLGKKTTPAFNLKGFLLVIFTTRQHFIAVNTPLQHQC